MHNSGYGDDSDGITFEDDNSGTVAGMNSDEFVRASTKLNGGLVKEGTQVTSNDFHDGDMLASNDFRDGDMLAAC